MNSSRSPYYPFYSSQKYNQVKSASYVRPAWFAGIIVVFVIALLSGCGSLQTSSFESSIATAAKVIRVVDGDTFDVAWLAGPELPSERIRLIGVDTPEVYGKSEPFGKEASAYTKQKLEGQIIWLTKDVSESDRYQRALRYVWLDDPFIQAEAETSPLPEDVVRRSMFNAHLLLEGYAKAAAFPPDVAYADLFVQLQREARENNKGLWSFEESAGNTEPGGSWEDDHNSEDQAQTGSFAPAPDGSCVSNGKEFIKGNDNSMIYHRPGGASYAATKAEMCFYDTHAAEAAGYRPSKR